jgi:hypothetical protein
MAYGPCLLFRTALASLMCSRLRIFQVER